MKVFNTIISYEKGSTIENYVSSDFPNEEQITEIVRKELGDDREVICSGGFTTDKPFKMENDEWCEYFYVEKETKKEVAYVCITRKEIISFKEAALV